MKNLLAQYKKTHPEQTKAFLAYINQEFEDLDQILDENLITNTNDATRNYIKAYFSQLKDLSSMLVLSADLAKSTHVKLGNSEFNMWLNSHLS